MKLVTLFTNLWNTEMTKTMSETAQQGKGTEPTPWNKKTDFHKLSPNIHLYTKK